jgi:general secretion pathway protein D
VICLEDEVIRKSRMKIFFAALSIMGWVSVGRCEDLVSMSFENTDLRLVIKFVSEVTGENFIVDEGIKGNVTILAPSKIPVDQLRQVLESVLMVSGYTLVSSGKVTKVVPLESARQASSETVSGDQVIRDGDRFVTQVIPLKFANAEKIAGLVNPFLTRGGHVTFYSPTNTLVVSDSASNVSRIAQIVGQLDHKGTDVRPDLNVYRLKNADAQEVAEVLSQLFEKERKSIEVSRVSQDKEISFVVADPTTNALLIHSSEGRYPSIQRAIQELDAPRKQVLVEVLVAEVNLDKLERIGIEWATAEGAVYGSQEGFAQDRVIRAENILDNVLTGGGFPGTTAAYVYDTLKIGSIEIPRLGILVNAFRNHSDINILSTPQILTTDHTEAEILVGENRAFIKLAQVTPEGSTVRTFEYKDVGLSLRLKPHITEDGMVRMEVHQKVEDVIGQSFEGAVETSKREARTLITVKDSKTAVIGGLIRDRKDKITYKVPILGDIPLLGLPFTRKEDQNTKTNLLIFICPHILDSQAELLSLSKEKKEKIDSMIKLDSLDSPDPVLDDSSRKHSESNFPSRRLGRGIKKNLP